MLRLGWIAPLALYALALIVRLAAATQLPFPASEPSVYYFDVARDLLSGEGLVSHAVWSYATAPHALPAPAFALWLPMSSLTSALAMAVLGPTYWAAQVGGAALGAAVAPLAWAVGRGAAAAQGLDRRRGRAVAVASGLLVALLSPFVLGSVIPESSTPFVVFALLAALLVPGALGHPDLMSEPDRRSVVTGLGLGLALGLAYLSRQEAIWLGGTVVLLLLSKERRRPAGTRIRDAARRMWPIVLGGLVVVLPWLTRQWLVFGSPFPGQAVENMFLVSNDDIFAFLDRPAAATYLSQGLPTVLGNPLIGAWSNAVDVLLVGAFPVGLAGLVALAFLWRSPALRASTALSVLVISGLLTFATTALLFPVATRWGTYLHASGPFLVALATMAALGGDALLARISVWRRWEKANVIIAPVALLMVAAALTWYGVRTFSTQSRTTEHDYLALARSLDGIVASGGGPAPQAFITDHPMWLALVTGGGAVALPDEGLDALIELDRVFDAPWVVVVGERGRYPDALLGPEAASCLVDPPQRLQAGTNRAWLFRLEPQCAAE